MIVPPPPVPAELAPVVEALADLLLADLHSDERAPQAQPEDDDEREAA